MARVKLSCDTIGELRGGRARAAINTAINRVLGDFEDRGDDGATRDVIIRIRFKPVKNGDGLNISVSAKTAMPALDTGSTQAVLLPKGPGRADLEFSPDSDRPDQPTIPFDGPKEE